MANYSENNKRIAKNTFVLYIRMLFLMCINFYASRVILVALGIEDFGVYNVVGGFVALFAIISQSLSSAASRFLAYEMGSGNNNRLAHVFSSTIIIHCLLSIVILILAEIIGIWFVNNKMVISIDRLCAANWVFQLSVLTFTISLMTVPHHAAIIAHERMSAFAYISIFEGIGKLLICFLVMISPIDRLVFYALLMAFVSLITRFLYYFYCKKNFDECHFQFIINKSIFSEIFSFASWNMIGSASVILRNQGGNILINLFSGPVVNASRAIANQILHAVNGFVENFYVALKPQITKSYANGETKYMFELIYKGSRLSFYMLFLICFPILINTEYILSLWLKEVPERAVSFVQLTLVFSLIESFSSNLITAQLASGKVRNYQLIVGTIQLMNIPVSYFFLKRGCVPETILYVAIFFSVCCLLARLIMLKININLNCADFLQDVVFNSLKVSFFSTIIPCLLSLGLEQSLFSFFLVSLACVICSVLSILYIGCNKTEREFIFTKFVFIKTKIH